MMYEYSGARNVEELKKFVRDTNKSSAEPIPLPLTHLQLLKRLSMRLLGDIHGIAVEVPGATVAVLLGGLIIGAAIGLPLGGMLCNSCTARRPLQQAAKNKRQKGTKEF